MKKFLVAALVVAVTAPGLARASITAQDQAELDSIVSIRERIDNEGWENVIAKANWTHAVDALGSGQGNMSTETRYTTAAGSDDPFDNVCTYFPNSPECQKNNYQLKEDGVQILATEVLYQTLTFYGVKHVFGKTKKGGYAFKVINPVEGNYFQDLETESVIFAIKQFRKYIVGLLCEDPSPYRVLALMNRFNLGERFRWDMSWALLGNNLPDAPNKFMTFGAKWQKFSNAVEHVKQQTAIRIGTPNGGVINLDPVAAANAAGVGDAAGDAAGGAGGVVSKGAKVGFIAKEVAGIILLVGDVVAQVLELVCVSDLSVNVVKEQKKQLVVYQLLNMKKQIADRYNPLRKVLDELGEEATEQAGQPVNFLPN